MTTREERLDRLCDLVDVLLGDVERHIAASREADDAFVRRGFVRCICAYIEGVAYVMKQAALLEHQASASIFSPAEVMVLAEHSPELRKDGSVVERSSKLGTMPNIRFALASFAHAQGINLNFGEREWQPVQKVFAVRNNLMHPKDLDDHDVSADEARDAILAGGWFNRTFLGLVRQTPARHRAAAMEGRLQLLPVPAA